MNFHREQHSHKWLVMEVKTTLYRCAILAHGVYIESDVGRRFKLHNDRRSAAFRLTGSNVGSEINIRRSSRFPKINFVIEGVGTVHSENLLRTAWSFHIEEPSNADVLVCVPR